MKKSAVETVRAGVFENQRSIDSTGLWGLILLYIPIAPRTNVSGKDDYGAKQGNRKKCASNTLLDYDAVHRSLWACYSPEFRFPSDSTGIVSEIIESCQECFFNRKKLAFFIEFFYYLSR